MKAPDSFLDRRKDGTVYGVPYRYAVERDQYILPDGERFETDQYHVMTEYVIKNIGKFAQNVLGGKGHVDAMRAISSDMERMMNEAITEAITDGFTTSTSTYSQNNPPSTITAEKLIQDMNNAIKKIPGGRKTQKELDELNMLRWEISARNEKIQKQWNKEFHSEVLRLVRTAMELGQANLTYMVPVGQNVNTLDSMTATQVMVAREPRIFTIVYNDWIENELERYKDIREQAEKAVRLSKKPPDLHPLP